MVKFYKFTLRLITYFKWAQVECHFRNSTNLKNLLRSYSELALFVVSCKVIVESFCSSILSVVCVARLGSPLVAFRKFSVN